MQVTADGTGEAAAASRASALIQSQQPASNSDLDEYAQSNWEARAVFSRSSSSQPRDSGVALGMDDGSQAEWEARACWEAPLRGASQEPPSQTFGVSHRDMQQYPTGMQNEFEANMQEGSDSGLMADGSISPTDECELGLQRVTKKAAATAALQKALSNIQYIATGSQKARAAAAASAAAEAIDTAYTSLYTLQPDTEHIEDTPQMAADDTNTAYWHASSAPQQTANVDDAMRSNAAAGTQQGWPVNADTHSLIAESSNSSDLSLDDTSSGKQPDVSSFGQTGGRAMQLVDAQHSVNSTEAEAGPLHDMLSTVQPTALGPAFAELSSALSAGTSPHMSDDAAAMSLSKGQPEAVLLSQPSASVQLPIAGSTELSHVQQWPPLHLSRESPTSPPVLPPADGSSGYTVSHASEHLARVNLSTAAGALANSQEQSGRTSEHLDTGSWPILAGGLEGSQALPSLDRPPNAGLLQGWSQSSIQSSWDAALQSRQSRLMLPRASQLLQAPSQSAPEAIEQNTDAALFQRLTSLSAEAHIPEAQISSHFSGQALAAHADTLSRQGAKFDSRNMFAREPSMTLEQLERTASQPDVSLSLAEPAEGTDGITTRRSISQVSVAGRAVCYDA